MTVEDFILSVSEGQKPLKTKGRHFSNEINISHKTDNKVLLKDFTTI